MCSPIIVFLFHALPFIAAIPYTPPQTYSHLINLPFTLFPAARNTSAPSSLHASPHITTSNFSTHSSLPSSNDLTIQCLPARYGAKIPLEDCFDAVSQIMPDGEIHDWADRDSGFVKQHFPLPFRFMGRECHVLSFIYIIRVPMVCRYELVTPGKELPMSLSCRLRDLE